MPEAAFTPPCCPHDACPSRSTPSEPFRFIRSGSFVRQIDGLVVQRFRCRSCRRSFSEQTFRATFRQKKPHLNPLILESFCSKTTHRQTARNLGVKRRTVERRLPLLGGICKAAQEHLLPRCEPAKLLAGELPLDELETFAGSRRNNPLTIATLVSSATYFILWSAVDLLPRRGGKGRDEAEPAPLSEEEEKQRNGGSKRACLAVLQAVAEALPSLKGFVIRTDEKSTYPGLIRATFGELCEHKTTHSKELRNVESALFTINLTFAMMRDGMSRLVRRNWGHSKRMERLGQHMWVWIGYRNYVRGATNKERHVTPAMKAGAATRQFTTASLIEWRAKFVAALLQA